LIFFSGINRVLWLDPFQPTPNRPSEKGLFKAIFGLKKGGEGMEKTGLSIGIIGGIGLGLLLGSEFSGGCTTILGAILVIIFLVTMGVLSYKGKK